MNRSRLIVTLVAAACVAVAAAPTAAQTTWSAVKDLRGQRTVCLDVTGNQIDYAVVGPAEDASATMLGPRRLNVTSRYIYADGDAERVPYTIIVLVDGEEVLRKALTAVPAAQAAACRDGKRVSKLRRAYVDLPDGRREVSVRAETAGGGTVAVRMFRQVRRQRESWVTFAPQGYSQVRHLQFDSGNQSVYYHFKAGEPLQLSVIGPTTLRLSTRLDFEHTMNGSQPFTLQVCLDGEPWRTFHFDSIALTSAQYVERPDILPGTRKNMRIPVPKGRHTIEIHCLRPESCGVATMIHIPRRDVQR